MKSLVDLRIHQDLHALLLLETVISLADLLLDPGTEVGTDDGGGNVTDPFFGEVFTIFGVWVVGLGLGEAVDVEPDLLHGERLVGRDHDALVLGDLEV